MGNKDTTKYRLFWKSPIRNLKIQIGVIELLDVYKAWTEKMLLKSNFYLENEEEELKKEKNNEN